eukprot:2163484-Prymnesium_polylepis.1
MSPNYTHATSPSSRTSPAAAQRRSHSHTHGVCALRVRWEPPHLFFTEHAMADATFEYAHTVHGPPKRSCWTEQKCP